ncbi:MAG: fatty acid hydroxylase family protein [Pseudomonadota bacterium]|nr:fatty acid hydroxylase family protein [Pseudomonadota bacterium]
MMTERQRKFREKYVSEISPWYSGWLHVVVTFGVGIAAIAWCVSRMDGARWEWLLIIPVAIAGNFVEWGMHQHVMHRLIDKFAIRAIYDRHTRQHHQYFTDNDHVIHSTQEFRIVFFPWRLLATLGVIGGALGWVASAAWNANAGYVVFITMIGHYLVYELFHFCCHVPENGFVRNMPFVNTIRRHHAAHHNMGIMMHVNMNLTFPIADWALGTSDLNRGLLGHLFNGYNDKHVKEELKPVITRFRTAQTQDERVTLDGPRLTQEEARTLDRAAGHA